MLATERLHPDATKPMTGITQARNLSATECPADDIQTARHTITLHMMPRQKAAMGDSDDFARCLRDPHIDRLLEGLSGRQAI
jgi:hypothetical protein